MPAISLRFRMKKILCTLRFYRRIRNIGKSDVQLLDSQTTTVILRLAGSQAALERSPLRRSRPTPAATPRSAAPRPRSSAFSMGPTTSASRRRLKAHWAWPIVPSPASRKRRWTPPIAGFTAEFTFASTISMASKTASPSASSSSPTNCSPSPNLARAYWSFVVRSPSC